MGEQFHITRSDQVGCGHGHTIGDQAFCLRVENAIITLEHGDGIGEPFLEIQQLFNIAFPDTVSHEKRIQQVTGNGRVDKEDQCREHNGQSFAHSQSQIVSGSKQQNHSQQVQSGDQGQAGLTA